MDAGDKIHKSPSHSRLIAPLFAYLLSMNGCRLAYSFTR